MTSTKEVTIPMEPRTEQTCGENHNIATSMPHRDPEMYKLLQETLRETRAARKTIENHANLFRQLVALAVIALLMYLAYKFVIWVKML